MAVLCTSAEKSIRTILENPTHHHEPPYLCLESIAFPKRIARFRPPHGNMDEAHDG